MRDVAPYAVRYGDPYLKLDLLDSRIFRIREASCAKMCFAELPNYFERGYNPRQRTRRVYQRKSEDTILASGGGVLVL